jgi:DNA repair protein RadC
MLQPQLSDLPQSYKPREKLAKTGVSNLTDTELIAILLGSGYKDQSVLSLSKKINEAWLKQPKQKISWQQLIEIKGIGPAKASTLLACQELGQRIEKNNKSTLLDQPEKVFHQLSQIKDKKQEHSLALYLNGRGELLSKKIIAIGSLNTNFIDFRQLLAPAITLPASGLILSHNHPSGNPEPSPTDIKLTARIKQGSELVGIKLVDHLVVTTNDYFSFKQKGLL